MGSNPTVSAKYSELSYMTVVVKSYAEVVELVDTPDSKSGIRKGVRVRVSLSAPVGSVKKYRNFMHVWRTC